MSENAQVFMALPGRTQDAREVFRGALGEVVRAVGLEVGPAEPGGGREWEGRVRLALRRACAQGLSLSGEAFAALVGAAVHDPDPSFNRQFLEPALNAFGKRRVRSALLAYLRTGTDAERAGAARAWYWSALPLRMPLVRAQSPSEDGPDVTAEWYEAALREFVRNENLDVRRCLLPGLPLWKSFHPERLHDLVDTVVAVARAHPDDYLRHRVEHQVRE
ncbi:hypothetical protein [Streptomyces sp. NPDC000983]|uniref:hypothetical protein n=1 Tax=Streptomyces sp. NPDC000983 TaxID=3154373 RepID=UPI003326FCC7